MARKARPWFLKKTDYWYVWWNGRRHRLIKGKANRKAAKDRFDELVKEAEANPPLAIADHPNDTDRIEIEPAPTDVARLNFEGVQFTWRITRTRAATARECVCEQCI